MQGLLDWLAALPEGVLLPVLVVLAFAENVFPPIPADVLILFGAFLNARAGRPVTPVFLAILVGNLAGAGAMFALGRRLGTTHVSRAMARLSSPGREMQLEGWYRRYGLLALGASRFVPGVRALVPPFAGALRLAMVPSMVMMGAASAIWYGAITWVATEAGASWESVQGAVTRYGRSAALVALPLLAVIGVVVVRRVRSR